MEAAELLRTQARATATVHDVDYVFDDSDPLSAKLDAALATAETQARP